MDGKQTQDVVDLVTTAGAETSEHAAMQSATSSGHVGGGDWAEGDTSFRVTLGRFLNASLSSGSIS